MLICGTCKAVYSEGERFCRFDGAALAAAPGPRTGDMLAARYRLGPTLGAGGFGVVFEAEDVKLGKRVAVKVLGPRVSSDPEALARFEQEALTAARIGHKGIIDVTDTDRDASGVAFLVMEALAGRDLEAEMKETRLPVARALRVAIQIADATHAAHEKGIVHRDLKPSNIFLTHIGAVTDLVKVLDFGISKMVTPVEGRPGVTLTGASMGTPAYMAPEQALDAAHVDRRVDVYALGCILYEMLAGRPPFVRPTRLALLSAHNHEKPDPPSAVDRDLPRVLDGIVLHALAKEPADRFATMRDFAGALMATGLADLADSSRPLRLPTSPVVSEVNPSSTLGQAVGERRSVGSLRFAAMPGRRAAMIGAGVVAAIGAAAVIIAVGAGRSTAGRAAVDTVSPPTTPPAEELRIVADEAIPPDAVRAYTAQCEAWNDCQNAAYFGSFSDLECYYSSPGSYSREVFMSVSGRAKGFCNGYKFAGNERLVVQRPPPSLSTRERAAFLVCDPKDKTRDGKLVVMEHIGRSWLVVGESQAGQNGCYAKMGYEAEWGACGR